MAPSQLGMFVKSDESAASPDLQFHVQPLSLDSFNEPLHPFPGMTASVRLRLVVVVRSVRFFSFPVFLPSFFLAFFLFFFVFLVVEQRTMT